MIYNFKDKLTEDIFNGISTRFSRKLPRTLHQKAQRKLDQINAATRYTSYTGDGGGHTHSDTFSNANESAHTHGIGSYVAATESAHTHASQPKFYDVVWIFRYK